jgi:hypothetical protein
MALPSTQGILRAPSNIGEVIARMEAHAHELPRALPFCPNSVAGASNLSLVFANSRKRRDFFPNTVIATTSPDNDYSQDFVYFPNTYGLITAALEKRHELCLKLLS